MDIRNQIINFVNSVEISDDTVLNTSVSSFCRFICTNYGLTYTEEMTNTFITLIKKYKSGEINIDTIVEQIISTFNISQVSGNSTVPVGGHTSGTTVSPSGKTNDGGSNKSNTVSPSGKTNNGGSNKSNVENKDKTTSQGAGSGNGNNTTTKNTGTLVNSKTKSEDIIDVEANIIDQVSSKYSDIESSISGIQEINTSSKYIDVSAVNAAIQSAKTSMSTPIEEARSILVTGLNEIDALDKDQEDTYDENLEQKNSSGNTKVSKVDYSWDEISRIARNYAKTGQKVKRANADFFKTLDGCIVNGNVVSKDNYKYNCETGELTAPNGVVVKVRYYVPVGTTNDNVGELNTITCLAPHGAFDMDVSPDSGKDYGFANGISLTSNAILVVPSKTGPSNLSYSPNKKAVIESTKFAVSFSGQKEGCSNAIIGCSSGGGSALTVAANAGDLYDTVVSINYGALKKGANKGAGADCNQLDVNEAENLRGKNIIFLYSKGDPNITDAQIVDGAAFLRKNGVYPQKYELNSFYGHGAYSDVFQAVINTGILDKNTYNTPTFTASTN